MDLSSDEQGCGNCGNICEHGDRCIAGVCELECPTHASSAICDGECVDIGIDARHCGGCGQPCTEHQTCDDGRCVEQCVFDECDGACTDTMTDDAHCGSCGHACATGVACIEGRCGCPIGRLACGGECVDSRSDARHCGECFAACRESCVNGSCCDGARCESTSGGAQCVDLARDRWHCGACDRVCTSGTPCVGGECRCPPSAPTWCPALFVCVDLARSRMDCGACGHACPEGSACVDGVCTAEGCARVCDGECIRDADDRRHCGGCGVRVPDGASCVGGRVVCTGDAIDCDGHAETLRCTPREGRLACAACDGGSGCAPAAFCVDGGCVVSDGLTVDCGGPHHAGDPPVPCRVTLGEREDVTGSPYLRWLVGRCTGRGCYEDPANAPRFVEHDGDDGTLGAGTYVPAGSVAPETIDEPVTIEVHVRFQLGATDVERTEHLTTTPSPIGAQARGAAGAAE